MESKTHRRFREPLPEGCPTVEAEEITASRIVFRIVRSDPPTGDDFRSQRANSRNNQFNVSECQARGLSVFSEFQQAAKQLKRPTLRGAMVGRVALENGAGYILQTGQKAHYTWWPFADFDVLASCQVGTL